MNNRRYVSFECKIILKYIGFNYSISFNTPLTQPLVSTIRPPKSFNFDGEFALTTPVPIAMTIFLEITPPARHVFDFYKKLIIEEVWSALSSLHGGIVIIFVFSNFFFQLFTDVLIKVYLGGFFPNLPSADFAPFIKAYSPTSFLMRSGLRCYNSSEVECMILSRY